MSEKKNESPVVKKESKAKKGSKNTKAGAKEVTANQSSSGLDENVAAAIAYIPLIALIFLFLEKKSTFVRFHSIQSLLLAVGFVVLSWIPIIQFFMPLVGLVVFVIGVFKAYNNEMYKFPVVGDIAEKQADNLPE